VATRRLTRCVSLAVTALLVAVALPAAPSAAQPAGPPSSGAERIASAQERLTELNRLVDIAVEDYAEGKIILDRATRDAEQSADRVARAAKRLARLRRESGELAAAAYRSGGGVQSFSVILSSEPELFLGRAGTLEQVSRTRLEQLQALRAATLDLERERLASERAVAAARAMSLRLARTKADIEESVAEQEQLVARLKADEAARIRAARLAEERRQARIRAAKLAEERRIRAAEAAEERRQARIRAERIEQLATARRAAALAEDRRAARRAEARRAEARRAEARRAEQQAAARRAAQRAEARRRASRQHRSTSDRTRTASRSSGRRADIAVMWARRQLGKPYVWAADGPNTFDCSGLTQYVWAKAGVSLPHSSRMQFHSGRRVSRSELRPGDLVFYGSPIHHVGIYIGGGMYINAPQTGDVVKISSIYRKEWTGAVRL
jgi:cell wall-associated NlpC family hydrolase